MFVYVHVHMALLRMYMFVYGVLLIKHCVTLFSYKQQQTANLHIYIHEVNMLTANQ